ncbi:MAG: NAD(P)H-binding protein [Nocardioides sp.]|uniref:NAD-dependent epimerase/dehydratase family protein n=1 Tax=Nocardioides sp. TaxID=35761 RepID=UPI0039E4340F
MTTRSQRVFVTGGTGAIGPHAVRALIGAGHEVTALARTDAKAAQLVALGARPVLGSLFDADWLAEALAGHDAVANLATAIPGSLQYARGGAWKENTRIRTEGSTAVVDAALAAGVPRLIQESIALAYPDRGREWIDESVPLELFPIVRSTPVAEGNVDRFTAAGGTGVTLRFGLFYGPGSVQSAEMIAAARWHLAAVLGPPTAYWSPIHLEDAGAAVAAALTAGAGVYNVVDDEPVTKTAFASAIGDAVGVRAWIRGPGRLVGLAGASTSAITRSLRVSNRRFKDATGWAPRYPSAREGWRATVAGEAR